MGWHLFKYTQKRINNEMFCVAICVCELNQQTKKKFWILFFWHKDKKKKCFKDFSLSTVIYSIFVAFQNFEKKTVIFLNFFLSLHFLKVSLNSINSFFPKFFNIHKNRKTLKFVEQKLIKRLFCSFVFDTDIKQKFWHLLSCWTSI